MFRYLFDFSVVTQFLLPSISPGSWHMHSLMWRRQTLGEDADVSRRTERFTSDSVSSVLICHKCLLFPMAIDKGQRTYEEHAFLMWHPHQIHHSGLSRMPMTLCSSSNYRETEEQYESASDMTKPEQFSTLCIVNLWTWGECCVGLENNLFFKAFIYSEQNSG